MPRFFFVQPIEVSGGFTQPTGDKQKKNRPLLRPFWGLECGLTGNGSTYVSRRPAVGGPHPIPPGLTPAPALRCACVPTARDDYGVTLALIRANIRTRGGRHLLSQTRSAYHSPNPRFEERSIPRRPRNVYHLRPWWVGARTVGWTLGIKPVDLVRTRLVSVLIQERALSLLRR